MLPSNSKLETTLQGQVVAAYSRKYLVELAPMTSGDNQAAPGGIAKVELLPCLTRGKKSEVACGDRVEIQRTGDAQGVIEKVSPRKSLLHRSDAYREKLIAANITQVIVVVASEPSYSDEVLARCLIAAHHQQLATLIILNKIDVVVAAAKARAQLQSYRDIGYRVLELSAKNDIASLRPYLEGHSSVMVGQSGMGKSTLLNALLPDTHAATREISSALNSGKHTTTQARLYHLNANSHLIDCPGVQAFGLHHLDFGDLEEGFIEFAPYRGQCHFNNCHHLHEPNCALRLAAEAGKIDARRLQLFQEISLSVC